jgi:hypothetical protein
MGSQTIKLDYADVCISDIDSARDSEKTTTNSSIPSKSLSRRWARKRSRRGSSSTSSDDSSDGRTMTADSNEKTLYSSSSKASDRATTPSTFASFCFAPFTLFDNRRLGHQYDRLPSDWRRVPRRTTLALHIASWRSSKHTKLPLWDAFVRKHESELIPHLKPGQVSEISRLSTWFS